MTLDDAIALVENSVADPKVGLSDAVFYMVSRLTPMVNVDLLINNPEGQTLLTWREDPFHDPGWHVPGGIVRFKESFASRIAAVAAQELGATVRFAMTPLRVSQLVEPVRTTRGHFISLLYQCQLTSPLDAARQYQGGVLSNGVWGWHDHCPANIISCHHIYRDLIDSPLEDSPWSSPRNR